MAFKEDLIENGVPGRNRTCNLLIRSQMLCPIELQVRLGQLGGDYMHSFFFLQPSI